MGVKVTVKLYKEKINAIVNAQKVALEQSAEAMKTDIVTSEVVPKQTGELERSGFVDISNINEGKASIVFDTPYARRHYWHPEYNFRRDKNVNAQGLWMQNYVDGEKKDFTREAFKKFLKMNSRGVIK